VLAVKRGEDSGVEKDGMRQTLRALRRRSVRKEAQVEGGGWARCDYQEKLSSKRQSLALARGSQTRLSRAGYGSSPTSNLVSQYHLLGWIRILHPKQNQHHRGCNQNYELTHSANSEVANTDLIL